ncbi:O-antigen ligase family protein [Candidatus Pelagibacter sp.]|nr:O-antigen ligase family protein [Candidatus Pelagibacter sp.]
MKIFFVIFFILSFGYILKNLDEKKIQTIYKSWSIIFLFVTLDLIFEYYSGKNILGFASVFPGKRLGSFTGSESVIGNYYLGFCLLTLSYVKLHLKLNNFNLFLALLFIIISFFIGERANFIRTFMIISFYSFMLYDTKLRYKLIGITTVILILIIFLNLNKNYKTRYYNEIGLVFQKGISSYLKESNYGAHRNVAIEIFKDNPYFGVGIKNFRVESGSEKYDNLDHKQNYLRVSTHPHELYHEFLSENGLFGLISFIIFISLSLYFSIKNYLINRNIFQLSSILFICSSILPVLPAGSFLSTFSSSIFWINYAIMMSYNLKKIKS